MRISAIADANTRRVLYGTVTRSTERTKLLLGDMTSGLNPEQSWPKESTLVVRLPRRITREFRLRRPCWDSLRGLDQIVYHSL